MDSVNTPKKKKIKGKKYQKIDYLNNEIKNSKKNQFCFYIFKKRFIQILTKIILNK
jgi:hypothetical protein